MTPKSVDDRPCAMRPNFWQKIRSLSAERSLYHLLSEKWCGNDTVPLDHRTLYVDEDGLRHVFMFLNDSFEIGIGWPDKWHVFLRRKTVHKFIFWYLRQWTIGEWLGIRRWAWYKLLNRKVERHRRTYAKT